MPQAEGTSESAQDCTVKKCLDIFSGIGANISEFDIDAAHRVPTRNQNGRGRATGRPFPIICTFTRRIARDEFAGFFYDRHDIETVRKYRTTLNRITFG